MLRVWSSIRSTDDLGLFHRIERNINKKKENSTSNISSSVENSKSFQTFQKSDWEITCIFSNEGKARRDFFPPERTKFHEICSDATDHCKMRKHVYRIKAGNSSLSLFLPLSSRAFSFSSIVKEQAVRFRINKTRPRSPSKFH